MWKVWKRRITQSVNQISVYIDQSLRQWQAASREAQCCAFRPTNNRQQIITMTDRDGATLVPQNPKFRVIHSLLFCAFVYAFQWFLLSEQFFLFPTVPSCSSSVFQQPMTVHLSTWVRNRRPVQWSSKDNSWRRYQSTSCSRWSDSRQSGEPVWSLLYWYSRLVEDLPHFLFTAHFIIIIVTDELRATVSVGLIVSSPHVGYTAPAVFFGAQYSVRCILDISRRRCYKLPRAARRGASQHGTWYKTARHGTRRVGKCLREGV